MALHTDSEWGLSERGVGGLGVEGGSVDTGRWAGIPNLPVENELARLG